MSWLQWKDDFEKCYKRKQWKIILFVIWICDMFPALQPNPALVKWTEPFLGAGMKLGQRKLFLSSHPHVLVLGDSLEDRKHWWRLSFWNVSADKRKKFQKHISLYSRNVFLGHVMKLGVVHSRQTNEIGQILGSYSDGCLGVWGGAGVAFATTGFFVSALGFQMRQHLLHWWSYVTHSLTDSSRLEIGNFACLTVLAPPLS